MSGRGGAPLRISEILELPKQDAGVQLEVIPPSQLAQLRRADRKKRKRTKGNSVRSSRRKSRSFQRMERVATGSVPVRYRLSVQWWRMKLEDVLADLEAADRPAARLTIVEWSRARVDVMNRARQAVRDMLGELGKEDPITS